MRRLLTMMFAALILAAPAAAHEIWVERDGNGPARIYLGEPAQPFELLKGRGGIGGNIGQLGDEAFSGKIVRWGRW